MDLAQDLLNDRVKSIANSIVDVVLARVTEEIKLSWYFKDNLKKLEKALKMIKAISSAATATSNEAVKLWLLKLEDIVSDAENMLDVLAYENVRHKQVKKLFFSKRLHSVFYPSNPVLVQPKMGHWVRRIDSSIRAAYKEAHILGRRPADLPSHHEGPSAEGEHALRQIRDIPDTSFVVGRADDKAKVVDMLCNPCINNVPNIVAIIGLGGLGKTVLAQQVYDDELVKSQFNESIWITVSRDFSILKILNGMVEFIKKSKCDSVELARQTLSEHLSGKKYLLVLDDVWNTHQGTWDSLHSTLVRIRGSTDSKILVTARDSGVAETMHTSLIHRLPELSQDNSWSLFKRIAFANMTSEHASVLEGLGKRIVNKCGGVPLAIKTTAGVLSNKNRAHEWESIEKSYLWDLDEAGILPSLMLSYTYLSSPLKKCFSFLAALYVKGDKWDKDFLMRLWIANGFLCEPLKKTMEDIGDGHFTKLLRISFLQEHERDEFGEVPKSIAGMKCLKFLDLSGNPIKVLPDWIMTLYNLQTLYLRDCPNLCRIPEGLGNLVNLRHFGVDKFLELPTGVEHLSCVQTLPPLWVRDDGGFQIAELTNLHHVSGELAIAGLELIKSKQDAEMANLSDKSRVKKLILRWTEDSREDHSMDLDEEVLDGLYPNSNLRLLGIVDYGSKKFPAWVKRMDVSRDNVSSQSELRNLTMFPCLKILEISIMKSLKRMGRELYGCDLSSSTKPLLLECFPRLEELRLINLPNLEEWCELESPMVCFPHLELLDIEWCAKLRTTPRKFPSLKNFTAIAINSGFSVSNIISNNTTLHDLDIRLVEELENLPEELLQCASLQTLTISNCPKLTSLPDVSSGLTSLRELSISCNESLSCPPSNLKSCTSLETLEFYKCHKSKAITEDLSGLSRLSQLRIAGQTELISQPPDWLLNGLPRLQFLDIGDYVELDHFPDISPLLKITSLVTLYLWGWPKLQTQTLPDQLQRFTRLTELYIDSFDELEQLPECLGNLSSLEALSLYRCQKLERLASEDAMKRLTKLVYMEIWKCPQLGDNVRVDGTEHHKVAHIEVAHIQLGLFKPDGTE